ncbi:hypothetical protein [Parafrankia sp. FMc2]|uniref:hypothetical protein n=1 Tax=Parafrankia sp. FMc2 TaxID=3233196 RepID=UPI0034D48EE2
MSGILLLVARSARPHGASSLVDGVIVMEGWVGAHAVGATGSRSSGFVGSVFAGPDGALGARSVGVPRAAGPVHTAGAAGPVGWAAGSVGRVGPAGAAGAARLAETGGTTGAVGGGRGGAEIDRSVAEACRYQVFDGDDQFVGVFESWDAAHAWGHRRAAEPGARLPLRIEDHLDGRTWTVEPGLCQLSVWRRQPEPEPPPVYVTAAAEAAAAAGPASAARAAPGAGDSESGDSESGDSESGDTEFGGSGSPAVAGPSQAWQAGTGSG